MEKKIQIFIIILLTTYSHSWAISKYPFKWKEEIQFLYDKVFPAIPSTNLPKCDFKRRQWNTLQIRQSINVHNEIELAKAIVNNKSIIINLKADILLSGNTTTSRNKTGAIQALLNINKQKNIIINGEGHKIFEFSNPIEKTKLKGNRLTARYFKEVKGNEAFVTSSGEILQLAQSKTYRARGWDQRFASQNVYGLILPKELQNINITKNDHVFINFRISFVRLTYQVLSCSDGVIYFAIDKNDHFTSKKDMRDLSPQTDFFLTNYEESDNGVLINKGVLSYPSHYGKISQCEANYIFYIKEDSKVEINGLSIIGGMEYGIMNSASLCIHHSMMTNKIFGGIYNTGILFANNNTFDNIKTSATRTEHYPYHIKNHDPYMEVVNNVFSNIGHFSSNTHAVWSDATAYIAHNEFINTNYSAIRIGKLNCKDDEFLPDNLVEYNYFHHTAEWIDERKQIGFQDSGDIYITPNNRKATVRYNTILNCGGLGKNIGIYGDDGAYNMEIYCNIIFDTENYYDIDCRDGSKKGENKWTIPRSKHLSTNNFIAYNVCNGYLRMQENKNNELKATGCKYINNFIVGSRTPKGNDITDLVNLQKKRRKAIIRVNRIEDILPLVK
ncbi:MAG: hypothetical protein IKI83_01910 [Prevotella sp.]|nr:hypothetical protein [Prevotella sp.]